MGSVSISLHVYLIKVQAGIACRIIFDWRRSTFDCVRNIILLILYLHTCRESRSWKTKRQLTCLLGSSSLTVELQLQVKMPSITTPNDMNMLHRLHCPQMPWETQLEWKNNRGCGKLVWSVPEMRLTILDDSPQEGVSISELCSLGKLTKTTTTTT